MSHCALWSAGADFGGEAVRHGAAGGRDTADASGAAVSFAGHLPRMGAAHGAGALRENPAAGATLLDAAYYDWEDGLLAELEDEEGEKGLGNG